MTANLLSAGTDGSIHIFDLDATAKKNDKLVVSSISRLQGAHKFAISGVNWFPGDTGMFTTGSMDATIKVWDTNALENRVLSHAFSPIGTVPCLFTFEGKRAHIVTTSIATSHTLLACGLAEPRVRLCDLRTGGSVQALTGHQASVFSVKFSPINEWLLVSGGADKSIRFWDIRKARACVLALDLNNSDRTTPNYLGEVDVIAHDGLVNGLCFTSNGKHLISTAHDERIRLWDVSTGRNTLTNYGPNLHNRAAIETCPVVTPINMCHPPLIYHPSDHRQVLVFDMMTGALVKRLRGHFGRVNCVELRSEFQELYSGGNDHEILIWAPPEKDEQPLFPEAHQATADAWSDDER
ncbi:hypothetical protein SmJEL517_g03207 [Synchytrium microbalum]|uniref:Uncharacterized protein n=1 Tax=Synchytrium microbalum TaxID=1806994 RepID=A0A507C7L6_9FUNG|nr:uncharacterized protein SmJEL517_g03207 [Synchytrium microbalum]TPX33986.1 hypothetical protein SmJEL517_g03207 [Synchytrium microbalum]